MIRNRRGFSLIEALAVISLTGLVLGLCTTTIGGLFRAERAIRVQWSDAATIDRLAERFRDDIHQAIAPPKIDMGDLVIPLGDAAEARYWIEGETLWVTLADASPNSPRTEVIRLKGWTPTALEIDATLARLAFRPAVGASRPEVTIEAFIPPFAEEAGR